MYYVLQVVPLGAKSIGYSKKCSCGLLFEVLTDFYLHISLYCCELTSKISLAIKRHFTGLPIVRRVEMRKRKRYTEQRNNTPSDTDHRLSVYKIVS